MARNNCIARTLFIFSLLLIVSLAFFANLVLYFAPVRELVLRHSATSRNPINIASNTSGPFFGVTVDWERGDTPEYFSARLGRPPAVFQFFIEAAEKLELTTQLKYIVEAVAAVPHAILALTVMPTGGLEKFDARAMDQTARVLETINAAGVPVLLRYAHEMNGNWYNWGQRPSEYVVSFRALALAVRARTKTTYLVWAPNIGAGYPWAQAGLEANSISSAAAAGSPNFNLADSNRDGRVNGLDDPYSPYYPGDEYVDFIGLSLFFFGDGKKASNRIAPASYFDSVFNGITKRATGSPVFNLYESFCVSKQKKMLLMETGAAYYSQVVGSSKSESHAAKKAWWNQVLNSSVMLKYPLIHLYAWFDIEKLEPDPAGVMKDIDFSISHDKQMAAAFRKDLPPELLFADSKGAALLNAM